MKKTVEKNIVGNSLKTIFSRITTNSQAIGALEDIGISIKDIEGNVRPVADILNELASRWNSLTDAERQNTAVKAAGTQQLSRFNALMLNYSMAQNATATSIDSFNSAMSEQEKYGESLQARLNRLNTAWYNLASTAGDTVIYDGIVVITQALSSLANSSESLIGTIGLLAPAFGLIGVAIYALNPSLRALIASNYQLVASNVAATGASGVLAGALRVLGTAAITARAALTGLLAATGIGLLFAGIGFAVEKLTSALSDNIQKKEQFDAAYKKDIDALTVNKKSTEDLIQAYKDLEAQRTSGASWDGEKEKEYLKVQQQLGEVFPSLIDHIDAQGRSHILTGKALEEQIEATKNLIAAQKEQTRINAESIINESASEVDKLKSSVKSARDELQVLENAMNSPASASRKYGSMENVKKMVADSKVEVRSLEQEMSNAAQKINGSILDIADSYSELEISPSVRSSVRDFVTSLDFTEMDTGARVAFARDLAVIREEMEKAVKADNSKAFKSAVDNINELAKQTKGFKVDTDSLTMSLESLKALGVIEFVDGEGLEQGSEAIATLVDKMVDYKGIVEETLGISSSYNEAVKDLIFQYDVLTSTIGDYTEEELQSIYTKKQLTNEEKRVKDILEQRKGIMEQLSAAYPELFKKEGKSITLSKEKREAIEKENKANELLLEAYKLSRDGKLTYEQEMTLEAALQSRSRIGFLENEIKALELVLSSYENMKASMRSAVDAGALTMDDEMKNLASWMDKDAAENKGNLKELLDLMGDLKKGYDTEVTAVGKVIDSTKSSTKATKEKNEAVKESIYYVDEYANAISRLDVLINKQKAIQENVPKWSKTYMDSLKEQRNIEQQKYDLMVKQSKEMEKQLKNGKIKKTGSVTVESEPLGRAASGSVGTMSSGFGWRTLRGKKDYHRGIDIANPRGTKVEAFRSGQVIASGDAKKNGYHASYGNIVVIKDDEGQKHIYAHLDKTIAKIGDYIQAGTQLGTVGSTGNSTGNHLHYEVNVNGQPVDPKKYLEAAQKGIITTGNATQNAVSSSAEDIDKANKELDQMYNNITNQGQAIVAVDDAMISANMDYFERRKKTLDDSYAFEEAKIKNLNRDSSKYNATLNKQVDILGKKNKVVEEEIASWEEILKLGGLNYQQIATINDRIMTLRTNLQNDSNASGAKILENMQSARDYSIKRQADIIEFESAKIKELDTNSTRYIATIEKMNKSANRQKLINEKDLEDINKLIASGEYSGVVLTAMKDYAHLLTLEIKDLAETINNNSFDIVMNIKTRGDELLDDLNEELEILQIIQSLYEEGSGDYTAALEKQLAIQQKVVAETDATRRALQASLDTQSMYPEKIKETTEAIEEYDKAFWSATKSVQELTKAIEDSKNKMLEDIATKTIEALKNAIKEEQDERMKAFENEIDLARKASDKRKQLMKEEMDLFRKNVNERLQMLDRQESERSYNMEIDELESERNKIADEIALLSLDNSNEAKSKRKKLQEQLDAIDKQISEKRHNRDIELQKQALGDMLADKENDVRDREEIEDENMNREVERINRQKEYWQKYYNDLLNDERKFAQIRENIMNKNFDKVKASLQGYIDELTLTMPKLADTLDGTMQAVGMSIRQNVIDELQRALDMYDQFNEAQKITNQWVNDFNANASKNNLPDQAGNSGGAGSGSSGGSSNSSNLSNADYNVLFGKFLSDLIGMDLPVGSTRDAVKREGRRWAEMGRSNGSKIQENSGFNAEFAKLSKEQQEELKRFINQNSNILSGIYKNRIVSRAASLDTGGYTNWSGSGMDGKGGKWLIAHPNEVMLNKFDTKEFFDSFDKNARLTSNLESIAKKFSSAMGIPNINTTEGNIIVDVKMGDVHNASKEEAKNFGEIVANSIVDGIVRKRGGFAR